MFNFPNTPSLGDLYHPVNGPVYTWDAQKWVMTGSPLQVTPAYSSRNRVVNGAMQISQENVRSTNLTALGNYAADQWLSSGSSDGTLAGYANVPNAYIGADAGPYCITLVIGTADAAMAASQYLAFAQLIEGVRVADFQWGSAGALPVVLRFKATCSIATTFTVALKNGNANNRSFAKNCAIAANTPTWFTIPIPGDVTGTYTIDNTCGLSIWITLACGTTFQAPTEGTWNAGAFIATATTGNLWATANARFSFGAVGLYLDPAASGIPPRWEMPDEAAELAACMRYWRRVDNLNLLFYAAAAAAYDVFPYQFMAPMRIAPAVAVETAGTLVNVTTMFNDLVTSTSLRFGAQATAVGATSVTTRTLLLNSRM